MASIWRLALTLHYRNEIAFIIKAWPRSKPSAGSSNLNFHTDVKSEVTNLSALRWQACDRYEAAYALRPASHAALYNWGVALSDMARHLKAVNPGASYDFLLAATDKYGQSLKWNPNNPQVRCRHSARAQ